MAATTNAKPSGTPDAPPAATAGNPEPPRTPQRTGRPPLAETAVKAAAQRADHSTTVEV